MDSFVAAPLLTEAALCAFQEAREAFFLFHPHDYRILAANPAAERATGLTADQLRARRITDLFDTTDERDPAAVVNSAAVAEPQILSLHGGRLDPVSVHVRVRPVAAAPEPLGLAIVELVLEQELHEKRRVEAELVKVKGELIRQTQLATLGLMSASVAHDLRNPLGAVRNAAYYLRRKVPATEPKWVEYLAIIDREVVFCDQIITNMLELARSRAPVPEMLDLGELVRAAFQSARPLAEVHCQFQAATEPFRVHADPAQFRQVFDNLVKNSLDALAGRGAIFVEAVARSAGGFAVTFSDTGPGVEPELRSRLFEPLFCTKAKGTGLGLWICRQVVERHGGVIEAVELPGRGLAFRISLPR